MDRLVATLFSCDDNYDGDDGDGYDDDDHHEHDDDSQLEEDTPPGCNLQPYFCLMTIVNVMTMMMMINVMIMMMMMNVMIMMIVNWWKIIRGLVVILYLCFL